MTKLGRQGLTYYTTESGDVHYLKFKEFPKPKCVCCTVTDLWIGGQAGVQGKGRGPLWAPEGTRSSGPERFDSYPPGELQPPRIILHHKVATMGPYGASLAPSLQSRYTMSAVSLAGFLLIPPTPVTALSWISANTI